MIRQSVFAWYFRLKDAGELWPFRRKFRKLKVPRFPEAYYEDSLPVLWHNPLSVNDRGMNLIIQGFGECAMDNLEGSSLIVAFQIFHIFQHKSLWPVVVNDFSD